MKRRGRTMKTQQNLKKLEKFSCSLFGTKKATSIDTEGAAHSIEKSIQLLLPFRLNPWLRGTSQRFDND